MRTWEDDLRDRGQEVKPGASYKCPTCGLARHAFAIVDTGDAWACGTDIAPPVEDGPPVPTWDDVRGQRAVFLQSTDWTQLPDVAPEVRDAWVPIRQQARDVTDLPTVQEALDKLAQLREQGAPVVSTATPTGEAK